MIAETKNTLKPKMTSTRIIALGFLGVILMGTLLLCLPISSADGESVKPIDGLFTATTAVCVTGLVTVSTAFQWSIFGKIVILLLVQLGGLGVVTCATIFFVAMGKRITLKERKLIQESYNLDTLKGLVKLIKKIVIGTFVVEGIGAVLYAIQFIPEFGLIPGIGRAIFNAVSAFCNAGMDILGDTSLQNYQLNPLVNFTTMFLIVSGGIGYMVWWDLIHVGKMVKHKEIRKMQFFKKLELHTKVALSITGILIFGGALLFFLLEFNNAASMKGMNLGNRIMASLFQSVTTRTAGFFTIPQEHFTDASAMISCLLMFIGGSPGGTAGGIKTTTMGVLILTVITFIIGKRDTEIFQRKISMDNIRTALVVIMVSFGVLFISTIMLSLTSSAAFLDCVFEVVSAFATVGLSRDLTPSLPDLSKIVLIITMYIGRIGPITMATALALHAHKRTASELPEKRILIG